MLHVIPRTLLERARRGHVVDLPDDWAGGQLWITTSQTANQIVVTITLDEEAQ